jgi:hypothetical protein
MQKIYLVQRIPQLSFHLLYHFPHINKMPISYSKSHTHLHIETYTCNISFTYFVLLHSAYY